MTVFSANAFSDHEQVVFCRNKEANLSAIIAIHDRTLGPAVGGCRMWPYANDVEALHDVLRLSQGMTYKNALAGLPLGGGKTVIIGDPAVDKSKALLEALGEFIDSLGGRYWGAEDVGFSVQDIEIAAEKTRYVCGLSKGQNASGDPSPMTAYGVYIGIKAAVKHKLKLDSLEGLKIAVQGVGHVGYYLSEYLHKDGANLFVADTNKASLDKTVDTLNASPVSVHEIHSLDVDVFAPCAMGAILNKQTIPQIKAPIIAGAANNQLATKADGAELLKRGKLYAPDYVINAGGIINVAGEVANNYSRTDVMKKIDQIYNTLTEIYVRSPKEGTPTNVIADELACEIIAKGRENNANA